MTTQTQIPLNDQNHIPQIGLGVWRTPADDAAPVIRTALAAGYRHIDTASAYENEAGVGAGVRQSTLDRNEVFVTTKLWNGDQGYDKALRAAELSLKRLDLGYLDLLLIHWPSPQRGLYVDSWKALIKLKEEGRVRSIGVSNFEPEHLERIMDATGVTPVLNQIELHPRFQQHRLREFHAHHNIATECWSPLGQGQLLTDPVITDIALRHNRTPAQIIIRWHLENGLIVIPKSANPNRIAQNLDVFSFELDETDHHALASLDSPDGRIGPDPMTAGF